MLLNFWSLCVRDDTLCKESLMYAWLHQCYTVSSLFSLEQKKKHQIFKWNNISQPYVWGYKSVLLWNLNISCLYREKNQLFLAFKWIIMLIYLEKHFLKQHFDPFTHLSFPLKTWTLSTSPRTAHSRKSPPFRPRPQANTHAHFLSGASSDRPNTLILSLQKFDCFFFFVFFGWLNADTTLTSWNGRHPKGGASQIEALYFRVGKVWRQNSSIRFVCV